MLIKIDEISDKLAKELNIDKYTLREVNRSQWKYLLNTMQDGKLEAVKIMYLGKFSKKLRLAHEFKTRRNIPSIQKPNI